MEIADHLYFKSLALLSSWRLECEVSNIIQSGFLIFGSHDSAASDIGVHNEAVVIDQETCLQLNTHAVVALTNLESWYGRGLFKFWLTAGHYF